MNYIIHLLIYFEIYLIVALSLNLLVGYCGILSLAHAAYYAVGGYCYAIAAIRLGLGFLPATAIGMLLAAVLSLAISLPSWRVKGDVLVLVTIAVQALLYNAIYNWSRPGNPIGSWRNLTNGPFGITGIPRQGLIVFGHFSFLVLATGAAVLVTTLVWRITASPWGRALISMRDDELALRSLGKNTRLLRVEAFAISSCLAAVAGSLYASYVTYLDPSSASLDESILVLSMVLVGGAGNLRGPIVGALILVTLPEFLRFLSLPDAVAGNLRLGIYGLMLVLMMHFRPAGLCGAYRLT